MEFLGYSQTFIGVLTSLVVLCILDSGNFIHGILERIGDRISSEINSLDKNLDLKSNIEKKANYKLLQYFIKNPENEELMMKALELDMQLNATFNRFKSHFTPKFIKPANTLVREIKESKEQLIAPLYVLLYCVVVFVCDELVYAGFADKDFIVTFLAIFTSFSFVFWGILWYMFYRDIKIIPENDHKKKKKCVEEWICKYATWRNSIPVLLLSCFIPFSPSIIHLNVSVNISCFFIGVIIYLLLIIIITISRIRSHEKFGHYLYVFSLKHFGGLFILSLISAGILFICASYCNEIVNYFYAYTSFVYIKTAIIAFIILNGLFLPFFMPYKGFNRILSIVQLEAHKEELEFELQVKDVDEILEKFCKKIEVK